MADQSQPKISSPVSCDAKLDLRFEVSMPHQAAQIAAFVNSAYRGESSKAGWTTEADLLGGQRTDEGKILELIERQDSRKDQFLLLGFQDLPQKPASIVSCVLLERKGPNRAYLGMLTVMPTQQAQGLGRKTLEYAESFVQSRWNIPVVELTVIRQRPELIEWYLRRGYRLLGETRPFPKDDPRFGIPKTEDLEFVVLEKKLF